MSINTISTHGTRFGSAEICRPFLTLCASGKKRTGVPPPPFGTTIPTSPSRKKRGGWSTRATRSRQWSVERATGEERLYDDAARAQAHQKVELGPGCAPLLLGGWKGRVVGEASLGSQRRFSQASIFHSFRAVVSAPPSTPHGYDDPDFQLWNAPLFSFSSCVHCDVEPGPANLLRTREFPLPERKKKGSVAGSKDEEAAVHVPVRPLGVAVRAWPARIITLAVAAWGPPGPATGGSSSVYLSCVFSGNGAVGFC